MVNPQDVQANILKFHGRPQATLLMAKFGKAAPQEIRQWLKGVAINCLTSHADQIADTDTWKNTSPAIEAPVVMLALSKGGYEKAGFNSTDPAYPQDELFMNGFNAYSSRQSTTDRYHASYAPKYKTKESPPFDVMILIAHKLSCEIKTILAELTDHKLFQDHWIEQGVNNAVPGRSEYSIGPLGFVDGLSTPIDMNIVAGAALVQGINHYQNNGSYLAFRKMRVNQDYWSDLTRRITQKYKVSRALAEAMIMGRFRNGTPLALHQTSQPWDQWQIDGQDPPFGYQKNPGFCPVGAHARAANPRDNSHSEAPIIRRGMSYDSGQESGLLFMSYQKSITDQLLPILKRLKARKDLMLYADNARRNPKGISFSNYAEDGKDAPIIDVDENEMPILRGGEYLFCPPISFLRTIDTIS